MNLKTKTNLKKKILKPRLIKKEKEKKNLKTKRIFYKVHDG